MPTNSSDRFPVVCPTDRNQGREGPTSPVPPSLVYFALAATLYAFPAQARGERPSFEPAYSLPPAPPAANGSIFRDTGYAPLTSGNKAARVGDLLTIVLAERTIATKASSSSTDRNGSIGLTPPTTGPLDILKPSDVGSSGTQAFKGKGESAQSNALSGEVSVTIAEVYPNGTMLVRGEKVVTLSRGEERVQLTGIVRASDISADNRVASTRVADARIKYVGKGHVSDASRPGWLQRFFAKVSPF